MPKTTPKTKPDTKVGAKLKARPTAKPRAKPRAKPAANAQLPARTVAVRVWDLPTRLFHWLLVLAVIGSVVSAKIGGGAMVWHFRLGYAVLALLTFRLLWGLVGGRWSRFASFVPTPARLLRYLRGRSSPAEHVEVGHNPLGSLSVLAMLAILLVQVSTGLVGDDEIANIGPLNRFVSTDTGLAATSWHKSWGQWIILALIGLHLAAIAVYRWRLKTDLIRPMLVGDKALPPGTPASADGARQRGLAMSLLALCAAGVWALVKLGG